MNHTSVYALIKQAIREYYSEQEWLVIVLKNTWEEEQAHGGLHARNILKLNDYATIELTQYNNQPLVHVYVGISDKHKKRPTWISTPILNSYTYLEIKSNIHNLLNNAQDELLKLSRGKNTLVTLSPSCVRDVSNQLSN